MKRLRPFFGYYGSKWRLAPTYVKPRYDTIIEPFAGSAGYSCMYPDRDIVLVDSNPIVILIWRYLIHASPERILALPDVPPKGVSTLDVSDAERALIGMWCSKAPSAPREYMVPWATEYPGSSWWGARIRKRIADQLPAIRHWTAHLGDYTDSSAVAALEGAPATWFVDPPYAGRPGRTYTHGSKPLDYRALAAWCLDLPGQVIVCEAVGASWLPFAHHAEIRGVARRGKEAIWIKE